MPDGPYILVSGRRDDTVAVVDVAEALVPENDGSDRAVVSRPRVTKGAARGLPVSIAVAPDLGRIFVVNHTGSASSEEVARMPHGHPGSVAILDLAGVLDPAGPGEERALLATVPVPPGPVGCALTPDGAHLLVTSSEGLGTEDGGYQIAVIEAASGTLIGSCPLAREGEPCPAPSPHPGFGRHPNPCGIAVTPDGYVFTANGGTADVSLLRLADVLALKVGAEIARIPIPSGGFGLALSPDGHLLAVTGREDPRTGRHGETVTLIDVRAAVSGDSGAVVASVALGAGSRPTGVAFSPDGAALYVACAGSGSLCRIALGAGPGDDRPEVASVALQRPDGAPPQPRGVCVSPDGRILAAAGGPAGAARSSVLWLFDAATLAQQAVVTGVGNESYLLDWLLGRQKPVAKTGEPAKVNS